MSDPARDGFSWSVRGALAGGFVPAVLFTRKNDWLEPTSPVAWGGAVLLALCLLLMAEALAPWLLHFGAERPWHLPRHRRDPPPSAARAGLRLAEKGEVRLLAGGEGAAAPAYDLHAIADQLLARSWRPAVLGPGVEHSPPGSQKTRKALLGAAALVLLAAVHRLMPRSPSPAGLH